MELLADITEDDMIATFLGGEVASIRFGDRVEAALAKHHASLHIINRPNTSDPHENQLRRQLLREARGYGESASWFTGWPSDFTWHRASLTREELANVRYIVYSYWIDLTKGTLRATDAVGTIRSGAEIFDVSNDNFWSVADAFKRGEAIPPIILVGQSAQDLVVLEGHLRLTGYLLAGDEAPHELQVILGLSPHLDEWKMYSYASYDRYRKPRQASE